MKKVILILSLVMSTTAIAQDAYTKGMQKAFELWDEGKNVEAANMFERIANAEMDNWLPYYYVATIHNVTAFGKRDKEKLTQSLEKAQAYLDMAKQISPNNVEIMV